MVSPSDPTVPAPLGPDPADLPVRVGRYVRAGRLGAGGMGEVWKAWDEELQRWVALKFLKGGDPEEIARFDREARTAAGLSHPNIAAIYESGEAGGQRYIAMQWIDGVTLKARVGTARRELVRLIRDAARAVHFAHEKGIIHRDLKPDNLMVSSDHAYVMDFGLARPADGAGASVLTAAGFVVGTPAYMAPEQARGERVDACSDVYSLGATLYELVTGHRPFQAPNVLETLRLVQESDPKRPRSLDPRIDVDLETVILKCLEKEPSRRYPSAMALAQDLDRWLEGESVLARPVSLIYRARKALVKRKAVAVVAIAGLAAVAISLGILIPKWTGERKSREAIEELGPLLTRLVTAREWTRQGFRRNQDVRSEFEDLERRLSDFVGRHPSVPQGWYARGRERSYRGDVEGAQQDLEQAVAIEPAFRPAWSLLGQILLWKYQVSVYDAPFAPELLSARTRRVLDVATDALERGRTADREGETRRWGLAPTAEDEVSGVIAIALREFFVDKKEEDALARLRRAQEARPSEDYCRILGILIQDWDEKFRWLDRAVEIAPHQMASHYDRGVARVRHGDLDGAIDDFNHALEIDPGMQLGYQGRSIARRKKGDLKGAEEDCTRAIERNPGIAQSYAGRATVRQRLGDFQGALADLDRAIKLLPEVIVFYYNRGLLRMAMNDPRAALPDFNKVVTDRPDFAPGWCDRGTARRGEGDSAGALSDYTQSIEVDATYWKARYNRALLRAEQGDLDGALQDFDETTRMAPTLAQAWSDRGRIRRAKRDFAGAIEDYSRAIQLDGRIPEAWANRANARRLIGDHAGAAVDYRKALEVASPEWPGREEVRKYLGEVDPPEEH